MTDRAHRHATITLAANALLVLIAGALLLRARGRRICADRAAPVMAHGHALRPMLRPPARATAKQVGITQCDVWPPQRGKTSARPIQALLLTPRAAFLTSNKPNLDAATTAPMAS